MLFQISGKYLVIFNSVTCYRHNSYEINTLMSTFNSHKIRNNEVRIRHFSSTSLIIQNKYFIYTPKGVCINSFPEHFQKLLLHILFCTLQHQAVAFCVCNPSGKVSNDKNRKKISMNKCGFRVSTSLFKSKSGIQTS